MRNLRPRFQERALRSRRKSKLPAWFLPFVKIAVFAIPFAFLCVCLGLAGLEARKATIGLEATDAAAKNFIVDTQQQVHVVGNNVNHLIVEAGLTAKETRLAATSQRQFWDKEVPVLAARANGTFDRTDALLVSLRQTSDGLNKDSGRIADAVVDATTNGAKPALIQVGNAATATANTMTAAGKVLADPNIPATLKNINDGTHQIALTAGSVAHTADNLDRKVDKMLHPGFWGAVKAYTVFGAQLATDAIEMHYYLSSVAPGATVQTVKAAVTHIAKPLTHRPAAK